jgi:hypothetical protein
LTPPYRHELARRSAFLIVVKAYALQASRLLELAEPTTISLPDEPKLSMALS